MSEKSGKTTKGLMKVLMIMTYKSFPIYIRSIGRDVYLWDVIIENQLWSSFIIMKPAKGKKKLTNNERDEVVKMCYAGAAATVDNHLGIEVSQTDQDVIAKFEGARSIVEG